MMREWFTAQELADFELCSIPHTDRGVRIKAEKDNWLQRPRGEGKGYEYHISNLPDAARISLIEKLFEASPAAFHQITDEDIDAESAEAKARQRETAKVAILKMLDIFRIKGRLAKIKAMELFCAAYENRTLQDVPEWIYSVYETLSTRTLRRWEKAKNRADAAALSGKYGRRKGAGVIDTAENGEVRDRVIGYILAQHHLTAGHVRDLIRNEFGQTLSVMRKGQEAACALPNIRTFERWIAKWREDNAEIYSSMTDPDGYKNKYMIALGRADAEITRLNQLWEIDASPADVLLTDGRYSIYAIVDVWSRRMKVLVSKTATTEASLQLVRRAIMDWGVPEAIKTDNGSDFVSKRFQQALISLNIEQPVCKPFSPEQKPHVERAIHTLQHDLMAVLPGFIGHDVADRKVIEARKAFAQRLGVDDAKAFAVELTKEDLQKKVDLWCQNTYERREHSAINMSPFNKAASWDQPVLKIEDERALDLLLAPLASGSPTRVITKKGLRIGNHGYACAEMGLYVGKTVLVRCDPDDMGTIHCFHPESGEFLFTAQCPELVGGNRKELSMLATKAQKQLKKENTAEMRKLVRKATPEEIHLRLQELAAREAENVTQFPQPSKEYTAPQLNEAGRAYEEPDYSQDEIDAEERAAQTEKLRLQILKNASVTTEESDKDRWFRTGQALELKKANGVSISESEEKRLAHWKSQPWYRNRAELNEKRRALMSGKKIPTYE